MNVFYCTFGCKVNSFETAAIQALFERDGHGVAPSPEQADVAVVNSCTVTAAGDKKVRRLLRGIKRANPACTTVLCGCFPQAYPSLAAEYLDADIVTGTGNRADVPRLVERYMRERSRIVSVVDNRDKGFEHLGVNRLEGHTRAFLKIEDGCDRYCAYCVVPYARGPVRSLALDKLIRDAEVFRDGGYRELVLSGINLSFYGRDIGLGLADAVEAVCALDGIERVRLGSLEPDLLSDDTLKRLAGCEKLCPHFHLSLQSGCDSTLRRMGRRYDTALFSAVADKISALFKRPAFTTDVIVGFPGESEAEFSESLRYVGDFGFLKVHVFPYSLRPGTAAACLEGHLDRGTKAARARLMSDACEQARAAVMRGFVQSTVRVIAEQPSDAGFTGYTDRYLPALVRGEHIRCGDVVRGRVTDCSDGRVIVEAF